MANDEAIKQVAAQIKANEDALATAEKIRQHKNEFIQGKSADFFRALGESILESGAKLNQALEGSASADPPVKCEANSTSINLSKDDFPHVSVLLTVDSHAPGINFSISSAATKKHSAAPKNSRGVWNFDVDEEDANLVVVVHTATLPQLRKERFSPQGLSDFIFRKAFTVS